MFALLIVLSPLSSFPPSVCWLSPLCWALVCIRTLMHTDTTHTSLWTYMLPVLWKDRDGYRKNTDFNNSNIVAPHSSTLAWKIPWMEETGGLQSMGSLRVGHDWATSLSLTFMHRRRKWHPTPVFLPGESHSRGSLVGCCLWGHTESDMTEAT